MREREAKIVLARATHLPIFGVLLFHLSLCHSVAPTITTFVVSPALNHHQVLLSLISSLYPSIDVEQNCISVYNNVVGVPVEIHQKEKVYIPELNFGHLLTSSNYYHTVKKTTGGHNDYSPKLTNILSTEFVIETTDV